MVTRPQQRSQHSCCLAVRTRWPADVRGWFVFVIVLRVRVVPVSPTSVLGSPRPPSASMICWKDSRDPEVVTVTVCYSERMQTKTRKGKSAWSEVWGKPGASFQVSPRCLVPQPRGVTMCAESCPPGKSAPPCASGLCVGAQLPKLQAPGGRAGSPQITS